MQASDPAGLAGGGDLFGEGPFLQIEPFASLERRSEMRYIVRAAVGEVSGIARRLFEQRRGGVGLTRRLQRAGPMRRLSQVIIKRFAGRRYVCSVDPLLIALIGFSLGNPFGYFDGRCLRLAELA